MPLSQAFGTPCPLSYSEGRLFAPSDDGIGHDRISASSMQEGSGFTYAANRQTFPTPNHLKETLARYTLPVSEHNAVEPMVPGYDATRLDMPFFESRLVPHAHNDSLFSTSMIPEYSAPTFNRPVLDAAPLSRAHNELLHIEGIMPSPSTSRLSSQSFDVAPVPYANRDFLQRSPDNFSYFDVPLVCPVNSVPNMMHAEPAPRPWAGPSCEPVVCAPIPTRMHQDPAPRTWAGSSVEAAPVRRQPHVNDKREHKKDSNNHKGATTIMIGDLPAENASANGLSVLLSSFNFNLGQSVDFLYVPQHCPYGFANFKSPQDAQRAMVELKRIGMKASPARIQGLEENKRYFRRKAICYNGPSGNRPKFHPDF